MAKKKKTNPFDTSGTPAEYDPQTADAFRKVREIAQNGQSRGTSDDETRKPYIDYTPAQFENRAKILGYGLPSLPKYSAESGVASSPVSMVDLSGYLGNTPATPLFPGAKAGLTGVVAASARPSSPAYYGNGDPQFTPFVDGANVGAQTANNGNGQPAGSPWQDRMNEWYQKYATTPFKFDLNGEELYQQYKDEYQRLGRQAMQDTMGQAAGLTGGYGSTYAQMAGQQAYQNQLSRLDNIVPDVYAAAYQRWKDEQDRNLEGFGIAQNMVEQERSDESARAQAEYEAEQDALARNDKLVALAAQYGYTYDANTGTLTKPGLDGAPGTVISTIPATTANGATPAKLVGNMTESQIDEYVQNLMKNNAPYNNQIPGASMDEQGLMQRYVSIINADTTLTAEQKEAARAILALYLEG